MADRYYSNRNASNNRGSGLQVFFKLMFIAGICCAAAYFFINKKMDKINHEELTTDDLYVAPINTKGYTNIALFGVDARKVTEKNVRSDTIIVASINDDTHDVKLISVFRDTYVFIDDYGKNNLSETDDYTKITHAYSHGGPTLAVSTLNENFDLNITEYVTVNFFVLADIVDRIGGLTINVETDAMVNSINRYGKEVADAEKKSFTNVTKTGEQILDGYQVLGYARTRKIDSDFKRAERQREVLSKIFAKIKSSDISTLNSLYNAVADNVLTSMDKSEILELLPNVSKYSIAGSEGFPYNNYAAELNGSSDVFSENMINDIVTMHTSLYPNEVYEPTDRVRKICMYVQSIQPEKPTE